MNINPKFQFHHAIGYAVMISKQTAAAISAERPEPEARAARMGLVVALDRMGWKRDAIALALQIGPKSVTICLNQYRQGERIPQVVDRVIDGIIAMATKKPKEEKTARMYSRGGVTPVKAEAIEELAYRRGTVKLSSGSVYVRDRHTGNMKEAEK